MGCSPSGFSRPVFLWALTALAIEISVQALVRDNASPALRLLHLLPLLPLAFFFVLLARTIIWKMDEMQRRICLESLSIAFVGISALTFVFAGLQGAGLYRPPWEEVGTYMMALWAVAYLYRAARYR